MLKEDADLLVAALRSGKYEQGNVYFSNKHNRYCCLGVYAEIKGVVPKGVGGDAYFFGNDSCSLDPDLNLGLSKYGEFDSNKVDWSMIGPPTSTIKHTVHSLAGLNDSRIPFAVIADFIEKNWKYIE